MWSALVRAHHARRAPRESGLRICAAAYKSVSGQRRRGLLTDATRFWGRGGGIACRVSCVYRVTLSRTHGAKSERDLEVFVLLRHTLRDVRYICTR